MEAFLRISVNQATAALDLSELDLWAKGTGGKSPLPGGWYPSGAMEFLQKTGVVGESLCPYSAISNVPTLPENARRTMISGWSLARGRDELKLALLNGPVLASMRVWADFFYYKSGIYQPKTGPEIGDHAILLVGYDDDQGCWIAQNSWSAFWGENGFFRIGFGQINNVGISFSKLKENRAPIATGTDIGIGTATGTDLATGTGTGTGSGTGTGMGTNFGTGTATGTDLGTGTATGSGTGSGTGTGTGTGAGTGTGTGVVTATGTPQDSVSIPAVASETEPFSDPSMAIGPFVRNLTATSAVVIWATEQDSTPAVEYGSGGKLSQASPGGLPSKSHTVLLPDLAAGTSYQYRVSSMVANGQTLVAEAQSFTTLAAIAPASTVPIIYDVSVSTISSQSATISWKTDVGASGRVQYKTSAGPDTYTPNDLRPLLIHSAMLKNLEGGATYTFLIRSAWPGGTETISDPDTFTTIEIVPPTITNVSATQITATTAAIVWLTDREPSSSLVEYGTTAAYGYSTTLSLAYVEGHLAALANLLPQTVYHYRVRSKDPNNNEAISPDNTFTTEALAVGPNPPVISQASATLITANSATIVWQSDTAGTTQVEYGLTPGYGFTTVIRTALTTGHLVVISPLTASTNYHFRVRSRDGSGNESVSGDNSFSTTDSIAPTIYDLRVDNLASTSAEIVFTTDEPCFSLVEYGVGFLTLETVASATATTTFRIPIAGLSAKQTYKFRVKAYDQLRNTAYSFEKSFATPDQAVPVIYGITISGVTFSGAIIAWTTDEPCSSQVEWGTASGVFLATSVLNPVLLRAHSVKISGLNEIPSPVWYFRVRSSDSSGNTVVSNVDTFSIPLTIGQILVQSIGVSSATITWSTTASATSLVEYGTSNTYGNRTPNFPFPDSVASHQVDLTGLIPFTTYHFKVRSTDLLGQETVSGDFVFTTLDSGAPVISRISVVTISNSSVQISWLTDKDTSSTVEYGVASGVYLNRAVPNAPWAIEHSVTLANLPGGRVYYFRCRSVDASGVESISGQQSFATPGVTSPLISAIQATGLTETTALITWETDQPSTSQVDYGLTSTYNIQTAVDTLATTTHSVPIANLSKSSTYHFRARSRNQSSLESVSGDSTFLTPDLSGPQITDILVQSVTTKSGIIFWKTNEMSDSQVEYWTIPGLHLFSTLNSNRVLGHSATLSGLTENATYSFTIMSKDRFNNLATSSIATFTTLDRTSPQASVTAFLITDTTATISWSTDEPATSKIEYGTTNTYGKTQFEDALSTLASTSHVVYLTVLSGATTYHFRFRSRDLSGNEGITRDFTFTTTDSVAPVISSIAMKNVYATSASVIWKTNEIADSVIDYGLTSSYASQVSILTLTKDHTVTMDNLAENTLYHFKVSTQDPSGNLAVSSDYSFTTPDWTTPALVGAVVCSPSETDATFNWTTDDLSTSRVDYGPTTTYGSSSQTLDALSTAHTITINDLSSLTTYHYRVRSKNALGSEYFSGDFSFTTPAILLIQNVSTGVISSATAVINWTTTVAATCDITHGTTSPPTIAGLFEDSVAPTTNHFVTINLESAPRLSGSLYYIEIKATTNTGVSKLSGVRSFLIP